MTETIEPQYRRLYVSVPAKVWFQIRERQSDFNSQNGLIVELLKRGLEK